MSGGRRPVLLAVAWTTVALVIQGWSAWQSLPQVRMAFSGPWHPEGQWLAHWLVVLTALAGTTGFWLAARAGGSLLTRWMGSAHGISRVERGAMVHILGFGVYACVVVAFGLLGLFFRSVAIVRLLGFAGYGLWLLIHHRSRAIRRATTSRPDVRMLAAATLLTGLLLALFSLTPETWIDSLAYHLTAPQDFNKVHKWVDYHQDMYRYPLLPEGIYGQGLLIMGEPLALLLNLSGTLLTVWLLWGWADRLAGPAAGWLAVLSMFASDQVGFHMGQANEGMHAVAFATFAVWAWLLALERGVRSPWIGYAGIGVGWAVCAKYTAAVPGLGMAAWYVVQGFRRPDRGVRNLAWLAVTAAGASAPFLVNGWLFTGNPVYPLFFGGLNWSEDNTRMLNVFGCVGYDFSLQDPWSMLRSVFRLLTGEQPLLLLALPLVAGLRGRRWAALAVAWGAALLAWSVGVPCIRLMMPAFPAMSLAAAAAIVPWWTADGRRGSLARAAVALVLLMGLVETIGATDFNHRGFNAAIGLESADHYRARLLTTYDEATREVNRRLTVRDRLAIFGDPRGWRFLPFEMNRDVEDTPFMLDLARQAADEGRIRVGFRELGVRWVLLNHVTSEYMSAWWNQVFTWQPGEIGRVSRFWHGYADVVWRSAQPDGVNGGYVLYRLRDRPGPRASVIPFLPGAECLAVARAGDTPLSYVRRMRALEAFAPGVAAFHARIASRLLALHEEAAALDEITPVMIPDYPELDVLYGLRGLAYEQLGRFREAAAQYREAARIDPRGEEYRRRADDCARRGRGQSPP